jgi:hypothetical protein
MLEAIVHTHQLKSCRQVLLVMRKQLMSVLDLPLKEIPTTTENLKVVVGVVRACVYS